jgi:hypothetical protein
VPRERCVLCEFSYKARIGDVVDGSSAGYGQVKVSLGKVDKDALGNGRSFVISRSRFIASVSLMSRGTCWSMGKQTLHGVYNRLV